MHKEQLERISPAATISRYERVLAVDASLLDTKSEDAAMNPRKREIHVLHRGNSDGIQRMLNAVEPSSYVRPHRHIQVPKSETLVLLRGSLVFMTFLEDGTPNERDFIHLHPAKVLAVDCREGVWHTFFALEPHTVIFEAKAGPHDAATDKEFAPWAPDEMSAEGQRYLSHLEEVFKRYAK